MFLITWLWPVNFSFSLFLKRPMHGSLGRNHHHWSTYQRPPFIRDFHDCLVGDPNLFIGDPNLFIGDPRSFIGDPQILIGTLHIIIFHWRPQDLYLKSQDFHWRPLTFYQDSRFYWRLPIFIKDPNFSLETPIFLLETPNV